MPHPAEPVPARPPERPTRGLSFDDFTVGDAFRSGGRTITEADIGTFAGVSGDYNPLHVDAEFAAQTPFRGRIAHGLLVQSIASGLAWQTGIFDGTIAALKEMVIRYQSPVVPGDTVRLELQVAAKDGAPSSKRGWVRFQARVVNQRGDAVIEGEWLTVMLRRARSAAPASGEEPRPA